MRSATMALSLVVCVGCSTTRTAETPRAAGCPGHSARLALSGGVVADVQSLDAEVSTDSLRSIAETAVNAQITRPTTGNYTLCWNTTGSTLTTSLKPATN